MLETRDAGRNTVLQLNSLNDRGQLCRQADIFIELMDLRAKVGRDLSERPPPRRRSEMRARQFMHRAYKSARDSDEFNC